MHQREAERLRCDTYLLSLAGKLAPDCSKLTTRVLPHQQDIARELACLARSEQCQLIVMTSHGWEGLGRTLRGSVAEELARIAPCPVMIIGPHSHVLEAAKHHQTGQSGQ